MDANNKIKEYFPPQFALTVENAIRNLYDEDADFLELLSIDQVELTAFNEIHESGLLYYCNFTPMFFLISNLTINKKEVYEVVTTSDLDYPTVFHIISFVLSKAEKENMVYFIFPKNRTEIIYDIHLKTVTLKDVDKII